MNTEDFEDKTAGVNNTAATNPLAAAEMSSEQNYNMIDGIPNNTEPELTQMGTRSAVHSHYEGMVALVGADEKVYLGKSENYHYNFSDSPSYYDNSDESLLFLSHNPSTYQFLYSEGFVASQAEMLEYGVTIEVYTEYARLLDGVLKKLILKPEHKFLFAGQPFMHPNSKEFQHEHNELTVKGGALPFKDFVAKPYEKKSSAHSRKFENVDIIASLSAVVAKNTLHYQTDFEYDKASFIKAAESPNPEDGRFLWLSRPSGTECFSERETFIRDTAAFNSWTYYEGRSDELIAFSIEITGMENGHPVGNLFELNHEQHVQQVKQKAMSLHTALVTFESGKEERFSFEEYRKDFKNLENMYGEIYNCKIEVKDETAFQSLLTYQRDSRSRFPVRSFNAYIKKLPTRDKPSVTEKLNEAKKAVKPASPRKSHNDKQRPEL